MTYETIDWDAEAKRVGRAFGAINECDFEKLVEELESMTLCDALDSEILPLCANGSRIHITYRSDGLEYGCRLDGRETSISLDWDGTVEFAVKRNDAECAKLLAEGIFHLGLLSEQVELALKENISAHQKLEWTLAHEVNYQL